MNYLVRKQENAQNPGIPTSDPRKRVWRAPKTRRPPTDTALAGANRGGRAPRHGHARQPEARNPGTPPLRALPRCRHGHAKQAMKTATLETAPESWRNNSDSLYSDGQKEPYPHSPHLNHGMSCTTQRKLAKSSPNRAASAHANPMIQLGDRGRAERHVLLNFTTVNATSSLVYRNEGLHGDYGKR